jgi:MraZ protein
LDDKGRVHIPKIINRQVGDNKTLMMAKWGNCLAAFPPASFEKMGERLAELSKQKKHREIVRTTVSHFFPGTIKNGKLLIPQELRNGSKIEKKLQIVGMLDHIEIWNQSEWLKKNARRKARNVRDDLDQLGIL